MAAFYWIKLLRLKKFLQHCTLSMSRLVQTRHHYVIVFWGETNRSSLSQMFFKIGVFKNFSNFIGKYQCWIISWTPATLSKRDSNTMFSCKIFKIFKNTLFYRTPLVTASEKTQEISVVYCVAKWCSGHLAQVYLFYPISC